MRSTSSWQLHVLILRTVPLFLIPRIFIWDVFKTQSNMKMELFVKKIVHDFQPLTIYVKSSILDVWLCSKSVSIEHLILKKTFRNFKESGVNSFYEGGGDFRRETFVVEPHEPSLTFWLSKYKVTSPAGEPQKCSPQNSVSEICKEHSFFRSFKINQFDWFGWWHVEKVVWERLTVT